MVEGIRRDARSLTLPKHMSHCRHCKKPIPSDPLSEFEQARVWNATNMVGVDYE